jgi:hypothetical protein
MTDTPKDPQTITEQTTVSVDSVKTALTKHAPDTPAQCRCGWRETPGLDEIKPVRYPNHLLDELLPALAQIAIDGRAAERDAGIGHSLNLVDPGPAFDWIVEDLVLIVTNHVLFGGWQDTWARCSCGAELESPEQAHGHLRTVLASSLLMHLAGATALGERAALKDAREQGRKEVASLLATLVDDLDEASRCLLRTFASARAVARSASETPKQPEEATSAD